MEIDKQIYVFGMDQIECNLGKRQIIGQIFSSAAYLFISFSKTKQEKLKASIVKYFECIGLY